MEQLTPQKTVNYFGINLIVPDDKGWLATDSDGSLYFYDSEPKIESIDWGTRWTMVYICRVDLEGMDWKDTLMEVK